MKPYSEIDTSCEASFSFQIFTNEKACDKIYLG